MHSRRQFILATGILLAVTPVPALARIGVPHFGRGKPQPAMRSETSILYDADAGVVLLGANADKPMPPASLTKLMTIYLAFDALKKGVATPSGEPLGAGAWRLDTPLPISRTAARQERSKLDLKAGQTIMVRDALLGMIGPSANDAAVVVAEALGKTESGFAALMNKKAADLGMKKTNFTNASGLPDDRQTTTARDIALLMNALRVDFPEQYPIFKDSVFFDPTGWKYNGQVHFSHNSILHGVNPDVHVKNHAPGTFVYDGAEAGKTGYFKKVGCNMAAAIKREGRNIIAVVIGLPNGIVRDAKMRELLDSAFPTPIRPSLANNYQGISTPLSDVLDQAISIGRSPKSPRLDAPRN